MSSREIVLWLDERWYDALEKQLHGETVQDKMEELLDGLINQLVPQDEYGRIDREIHRERAEQAAERDANRRFAVFHVTERGESSYYLIDEPIAFLHAARSLRQYIRAENPATDYRRYYAAARDCSPEEFEQCVGERMRNTGRVVGAFDIDLDNGTFATLNIDGGWQTYTVKDVCTATYYADRRNLDSAAQREEILTEYLAGKELTPKQAAPTMSMGQTM